MKKEKFSKRIVNAVRALRGEPWPAVFEFAAPRMEMTRHKVRTLTCTRAYGPIFETGPAREDIERAIRKNLAMDLGLQLLDDGAVEFTTVEDYLDNTLAQNRISCRVRVVMPEEVTYAN